MTEIIKETNNKGKISLFFENILEFLKSIVSFVFLFELLKTLIISLAIVLPVRYFLVQPFYVKGASMEPSFYDHEYLIIDELSFRLRQPERGEVVVFKYPLNPNEYFIKRVIALPNERIKISEGQIKIFNEKNPYGKILDESNYLIKGIKAFGEIDTTLKNDEYFVLGDNRGSSLDSRIFGPVKKKFIIGKVLLRGWPIDRINYFSAPSYNF